jgi:hypothetical protein
MSQTKAQLVSGTTAQDLTVDNINTTSINSGQTSGRKNLIINGAMLVAQRGTSSTSTGYQTIDRIKQTFGGTNEAPTYAQVDVASGTTPYTQGFRKALKITNGNQTGGAGGSDKIEFEYKIEAQDIANSGWNYKSSSSFVTLSFWVKSSVSQNFNGYILSLDGTTQNFPFETGTLTADTWTKITKTIPGNSNVDFDNDNGEGLRLVLNQFLGTDSTGSVSLNAWAAFSGSTRTPDQTSTWYTTNDATWEITGLQLEVGSTATDFEHRSYGQELALCERYCQVVAEGQNRYFATTFAYNTSLVIGCFTFKTQMRSAPSMVQTTGTNYYFMAQAGTIHYFTQFEALSHVGKDQSGIYPDQSAMSVTAGQAGGLSTVNASAKLLLVAEI